MTTYAITGASGQLGRLTTDALLARVDPADVVLVTRNPGTLADVAARGVQVRGGDFGDPSTLPAAFAGVDRLLLISTDRIGDRLAGQLTAVRAAVDAGVGHLLYTSLPRPAADNPAGAAPDHRATEAAIEASGLTWTMLRNNLYADMQVDGIRQAATSGRVVTNNPGTGVAYVTRADCAAAAAGALASGDTRSVAYDVTGPQAVTAAGLAELATGVSGSAVEVVGLDDDAFLAGLLDAGLPEPVAQLLTSFGTAARLGMLADVTTAVPDLAGRPATPLAALV